MELLRREEEEEDDMGNEEEENIATQEKEDIATRKMTPKEWAETRDWPKMIREDDARARQRPAEQKIAFERRKDRGRTGKGEE
jgi:hypothetical protein